VANLGPIGNPYGPDLRASYLLIDATPEATTLEHRRVAYDHEAFIESVRRSRHPEADFILSHQRGEHTGSAPHADAS
jgi:hypothetical protein